MQNIIPTIKGLNLWTLTQKIKDHTTQKASTLQLLQKIDIYKLSETDQQKLLTVKPGKDQEYFVKKHGVLARSTGTMKSHSFVLQFLQTIEYLSAHQFNAESHTVSVLDTSNTARSMYAQTTSHVYDNFSLEAQSTVTTYGIQVGTGTNAPANTDYSLQTLILHGTTTGKLSYGQTSVSATSVVGANVDLVVSRIIINGSGGSITIREIGLTQSSQLPQSFTQLYFLLARDVVNQTVADTEVVLVAYTIRTTV
jgi:hypothetical protein